MCYPKPGPRCSRHVKNEIKKHHKSAQKAGDQATLMREHIATSDNPYGKYSYDDVLAKENERERHLKAYREALSEYKQTPSGLKVLRKKAIEDGMTEAQMAQIDREIKEDKDYDTIDELRNPYSNTPISVHEYINNKGARQLQLYNYNNGTNLQNVSLTRLPQGAPTVPGTTSYEEGRQQREHQRAQQSKLNQRFPASSSTGDATLHLAQKEQEDTHGNFVKRSPNADSEVYLAKSGDNSPYTQTPTSASNQGSHLSENYDKTTPYEGAEVLIGKDKTTIIPPKPKERPVFPTHRPKN